MELIAGCRGALECVSPGGLTFCINWGHERPWVLYGVHSWLGVELKVELKSPALSAVISLLISFLKMFTL